jgi:Ca2+-binding RTX toxin-like protein
MVTKLLTNGIGGDLNNLEDFFGVQDDRIKVGADDFYTYFIRTYGGNDLVDLSNVTRNDSNLYQSNFVFLGAGNDVFIGNPWGNEISDGPGNDIILLGDSFWGGNNVTMGAGNDYIIGGAGGHDSLSFESNIYMDASDIVIATAGIKLDLNITTAQKLGAFGSDTIRNIEDVYATSFADVLIGNAAHNNLSGRGGNDTIYGNDGSDGLSGEGGADILVGGLQADALFCGANDNARDVLIYTSIEDSGTVIGSWDIILEFDASSAASHDIIDLSAIDANLSKKGNQAFTWIGSQDFTQNANGEVRIEEQNGDTFVYVSNDGDIAPEMVLHLYYVVGLTAADFIL